MEANYATPAEGASPSNSSPYRITVEGDGLNFTRSVSESIARDIMFVAMGGSVSGGISTRQGASPQLPSDDSTSRQTVGEYLQHVNARQNADKIVAIGLYLQETQDRQSFTRDEVKSMFPLAGERIPGNFSRDFATAIKSKWIAATGSASGEFFVTNSGRQAVQAQFADVSRRPANSSSRRRSRKKAADAES